MIFDFNGCTIPIYLSHDISDSVNTLAIMLTICKNEFILQNNSPNSHVLSHLVRINWIHMQENNIAKSQIAKLSMK